MPKKKSKKQRPTNARHTRGRRRSKKRILRQNDQGYLVYREPIIREMKEEHVFRSMNGKVLQDDWVRKWGDNHHLKMKGRIGNQTFQRNYWIP